MNRSDRISVETARQLTDLNRARALGAGRERRFRRRLAAVGGGDESQSFLGGVKRRVVR